MQLPIVVGVILAVMALISFSGWFFGTVKGMQGLVLDDQFYGIRIALASFFTILLFVGSFWAIATVSECKNTEREGFFAKLNCEEYLKIKTAADGLLQPRQTVVNQSL